MALSIGDPAPPFTLPGTGGRTYSLSDYRGAPLVLAFYPGDNTPVCTMQLSNYSHDIDRFRDVGAAVLAISPQDVESHEQFSDDNGGFAFPLLADTDKKVAKAYDVPGPMGFYRRSVFVVDGNGVIRYAHRSLAGLSFRPVDELIDALEGLSA
jgi:thioredoxin-dependent peroxiredoxin